MLTIFRLDEKENALKVHEPYESLNYPAEQRLRGCVAFARKPLQKQKVNEIIRAVDSFETIEDARTLIPLMLL